MIEVKHLLSDLAALSARTDAADQRILERAFERDAKCAARLDELRPQAESDEAAGKEYKDLTLERGQLAHVIAVARRGIGSSD